MRLLMERQILLKTTAPTNGHAGSGRSKCLFLFKREKVFLNWNFSDSDGETGGVGIAYGHRSGSVGSGTVMGTSALPNSASNYFHNQQQHHQLGRHAQQQQPLDIDINRQLRQLLGGVRLPFVFLFLSTPRMHRRRRICIFVLCVAG